MLIYHSRLLCLVLGLQIHVIAAFLHDTSWTGDVYKPQRPSEPLSSPGEVEQIIEAFRSHDSDFEEIFPEQHEPDNSLVRQRIWQLLQCEMCWGPTLVQHIQELQAMRKTLPNLAATTIQNSPFEDRGVYAALDVSLWIKLAVNETTNPAMAWVGTQKWTTDDVDNETVRKDLRTDAARIALWYWARNLATPDRLLNYFITISLRNAASEATQWHFTESELRKEIRIILLRMRQRAEELDLPGVESAGKGIVLKPVPNARSRLLTALRGNDDDSTKDFNLVDVSLPLNTAQFLYEDSVPHPMLGDVGNRIYDDRAFTNAHGGLDILAPQVIPMRLPDEIQEIESVKVPPLQSGKRAARSRSPRDKQAEAQRTESLHGHIQFVIHSLLYYSHYDPTSRQSQRRHRPGEGIIADQKFMLKRYGEESLFHIPGKTPDAEVKSRLQNRLKSSMESYLSSDRLADHIALLTEQSGRGRATAMRLVPHFPSLVNHYRHRASNPRSNADDIVRAHSPPGSLTHNQLDSLTGRALRYMQMWHFRVRRARAKEMRARAEESQTT